MEKRQPVQEVVPGKLDSHMEKNENRTLPNTIHKNKLKSIKDLNIRVYTIKFLEKNIGQTHSNINHSNIFSDPPPRVMEIKTKVNKWDLIELKSFCTAKETINKMKRQSTEWEKIFASEVTNNGLISKTYKHLMKLYIKKTNNHNPIYSQAWLRSMKGLGKGARRQAGQGQRQARADSSTI